jgi:hypothetical protein
MSLLKALSKLVRPFLPGSGSGSASSSGSSSLKMKLLPRVSPILRPLLQVRSAVQRSAQNAAYQLVLGQLGINRIQSFVLSFLIVLLRIHVFRDQDLRIFEPFLNRGFESDPELLTKFHKKIRKKPGRIVVS